MRPRRPVGSPRPHRITPRPDSREKSESTVKKWAKKPVVWLLTVVVGAVALFTSDHIRAFLTSAFPVDESEQASGVDPINVVDVHRVIDGPNILLPEGTDVSGWDRSRGLPDDAWLTAHDAVPVGIAKWEIVLEGRRTREVVVTSMKPNVLGCEAPLNGSMIEIGSAGGGDKFLFDVDVDKPNPVFRVTDREGKQSNYFDNRTIKLPKGEQNIVVISAHTSGQYCRWNVDVEYYADGKRNHRTVQAPSGKPFAVTGPLSPADYRSVFLSGLRNCPERYRQVSGPEYAALSGSACGK